MSTDAVTPTPPSRAKRPIGVWILTILDGTSAGIVPAAGILFFFLYQPAQQALGISIVNVIVQLFLSTSIIVAAYRTWRGDDRARKGLLLLLTVHYGLLIYNNTELLLSGIPQQLYPDRPLRPFAPIIRPLIALAINYWYFLGRRPRKFFAAHNDQSPIISSTA